LSPTSCKSRTPSGILEESGHLAKRVRRRFECFTNVLAMRKTGRSNFVRAELDCVRIAGGVGTISWDIALSAPSSTACKLSMPIIRREFGDLHPKLTSNINAFFEEPSTVGLRRAKQLDLDSVGLRMNVLDGSPHPVRTSANPIGVGV